MGFLIDSNAVIYYLSAELPDNGMLFLDDVINETPEISVITQIEVLGFNNSTEIEAFLTNSWRVQ